MNTLDFLNTNSLRNYPLYDSCSRVSNDGLFTIPNDFIVDIALSSPGNDNLSLYISNIINSPTAVTIEISANTVGVFGTFQASLPFTGYNIDVSLVSSSLFPQASGMITLGTDVTLNTLAIGSFAFSLDATALLMRTYSPSTSGVAYLAFTDSKGNSAQLTGHVMLQGNSNIQFRPNGNTIYVDAGENLGLNKICTSSGVAIKTINGIPPDPITGDFTLVPDQCVSLTPGAAGLIIGDSCGQPCLGCTEMATLTTQVNSLESSILELKNFTNNMQSAVQQASTLLNFQYSCK